MAEFVEDEDKITTEQLAQWCLEASQSDLDLLRRLMDVRRQALREMRTEVNASKLYVGDRCYLTNVVPKKLSGRYGEIIEIIQHGEKYKVRLDIPDKNWREPIVHPAQLVKVESD